MSLRERIRGIPGLEQAAGTMLTSSLAKVLDESGIDQILQELHKSRPDIELTKEVQANGQCVYFGVEWHSLPPGTNGGLDYPARALGVIVWVEETSMKFFGNESQFVEIRGGEMYDRDMVKKALDETYLRPYIISPRLH